MAIAVTQLTFQPETSSQLLATQDVWGPIMPPIMGMPSLFFEGGGGEMEGLVS